MCRRSPGRCARRRCTSCGPTGSCSRSSSNSARRSGRGTGGGKAVVSAFDDEVVLELHDRGGHMDEQPSARHSGGVDVLRDRAVAAELVGDLLQVRHRAAELGHHERVPRGGGSPAHRSAPAGHECDGGVVDEHSLAAGGVEGIGLLLRVLLSRRHADPMSRQDCLVNDRSWTTRIKRGPEHFRS